MGRVQDILEKRKLVIDGALGTELERLLPTTSTYLPSGSPLWSGQVLITNPELVEQVHLDYINVGADMIITSTYQTSYASLHKYIGYDMDQAIALWNLALNVAKNAVKKSGRDDVIIAGSIGPYATLLANGSEYNGDYQGVTDEELIEYHTPLFEFYENSDVDIICIETIPSFQELKVIIGLAKKYTSKEFFISINPQTGSALSDGTSLIEVAQLFAEINDPRFVAVGINCTSYENVDQISTYLTDFPLFIYPNLGFVYDTTVHKFVSKALQESTWSKSVAKWLAFPNVKAIGGCCSTTPAEIKQVAQLINQ